MFNQVLILICTLLCLVFTGWVLQDFTASDMNWAIQKIKKTLMCVCANNALVSHLLTQHMRDPAPGACRQKPLPLQLFLLLHRHLFHRGLRGRDPADMALAAAGGHHDLRGSGGAASAGEGRLRGARSEMWCVGFSDCALLCVSSRSWSTCGWRGRSPEGTTAATEPRRRNT